MQGRAEVELTRALDTPTTRLLVARPGYFFPAHAGQRQGVHSWIGWLIDTALLGPLFVHSPLGLSAGTLGTFLVEGAKGTFSDVRLANNAQMKQMVQGLQG